jgi:hypothetical protein
MLSLLASHQYSNMTSKLRDKISSGQRTCFPDRRRQEYNAPKWRKWICSVTLQVLCTMNVFHGRKRSTSNSTGVLWTVYGKTCVVTDWNCGSISRLFNKTTLFLFRRYYEWRNFCSKIKSQLRNIHPIHQIPLVTFLSPELTTFVRGINSESVGLVRGHATKHLKAFPKRTSKKTSKSVRREALVNGNYCNLSIT